MEKFFANRGQKSDSYKRSIKPNSLFATIGKKNTGYRNIGKRSMKPNSLFGTFEEVHKPKRSIIPLSFWQAFSGKRSMRPWDSKTSGKRSKDVMQVKTFYRLFCDKWRWTGCKLASINNDGETDDFLLGLNNDNEDDISELIMNKFKRSDADFWATRGKRETGNDFWATRQVV